MTSTPVDIFSMLNRAQTEYNNNVNHSSLQTNHQNASVSAFFASVKTPANIMSDNKMNDVPVPHGLPIFQQHHHIMQNHHQVPVQHTPVNFVNIEQIEKQQMQPGISNNGEFLR